MSWSLVTGQNVSGYAIYRNYDNQGWTLLAEVGSTVSTYVDNSIAYTKQPWSKPIQYYVKSVSNIGLHSIPSSTINVEGIGVPDPSIKNNQVNGSMQIIPKEYSIASYPNPFNPSTVINYSIPAEGHVTIRIYNLLSQEVQTLVNESKPVGTYQVRFNAHNLPSGIYIARIQAGNYNNSIKLQLVK
ncbi:MAG: hypothetical protein C0412_05190 [Flavobacterium sp.]|nr:hypothetical protein [Flavobacterium sp.]